ncbi:MAG: hypothetical protein ACJAQ6_000877 [Arenicella sp.]|jgi:hypothetical protein
MVALVLCGSSWFKLVIHLQDILVNILLCIPLALMLIKLNPKNIWWSVVIALTSIFLVGHYYLLLPEYKGWEISDFAFFRVIQQIPLLMAMLLLRLRKTRDDSIQI